MANVVTITNNYDNGVCDGFYIYTGTTFNGDPYYIPDNAGLIRYVPKSEFPFNLYVGTYEGPLFIFLDHCDACYEYEVTGIIDTTFSHIICGEGTNTDIQNVNAGEVTTIYSPTEPLANQMGTISVVKNGYSGSKKQGGFQVEFINIECPSCVDCEGWNATFISL